MARRDWFVAFPLVIALAGCSGERSARRFVASGDAFAANGQHAEAVVQYLNAVEQDPKSGEARYKLAESYALIGDSENAFRHYVRAADLLPDDPKAQIKAATYLLVVGQFEDARTRARKLLDRDPVNVDAQIVLGNALAGLRNLDGAIEQLNEAIQLDPKRGQTYTNLALVKVAQGDWDAAKTEFERAVATAPTSIPARLALANFQWASGDAAATEASLLEALRLDDANLVTHRALATFYRATNKPDEAERHLQYLSSKATTAADQFALADFYMAAERYPEARAMLNPLTAQAVTAAGAQTRLAAMSYAQGDRKAAHQTLDALLNTEPNAAGPLLLKARWLLNEGRVGEALERATLAVAANPRLVTAHYIRGLAEVASHRSADAIKSFTEVLRLNPRAVAAKVQLSNLHLQRATFDSAVLFADEAIRSAPNSLDAHLARVRALMARNDTKQARAELVMLKKLAPTVAAVYSLEGTLELAAGNAVAARTDLEHALQLDPQSMDALQALTALDMLQNRADAARERVEARLAAGDETPAMLMLAAKVYVAERQLPRAEALLRTSIARDPLDTENYALLGRVLQEQHTLERAKAELDTVAASDPRNLPARLLGALIVHTLGDLEEARKRYEEVLKVEPRAAMAANNLAAIYADSGENLDLAQQLAESAAEQLPAAAEIQDTLGWIYYRRQLNGQAISRFEQSIARDSANPVYHYHLGLAYSRNGDRDRARAAFQKALELNPAYADAKQALAALGA